MMKSLNMFIIMIMNMSTLLIFINSLPSHYKKFHPLMMTTILMIINIMTSINLSLYNSHSWWTYITFLIMVGGLMILFLYFISFINNMITSLKFLFLKNLILKFSFLIIFTLLMIFKKNQFLNWYNNFYNMMENKFLNIMMMYLYNLNMMMMTSIMYLLLTLILIVKMILMNKYSLRKIN